MVTLLAIDVGSSSVKAAVLVGTQPAGPLIRTAFPTHYDGVRAEVDPDALLKAVGRAARAAVAGCPLGKSRIDLIALSAMSPSWVALDRRGKPLTPIITHQDRRSQTEARWIESEVGMGRHLALTGNRPVPGGISSTTARWFAVHHPALLRRVTLVGHAQTLLLHHLTGARAIDPSNASFTGLWNTTDTAAHVADWNPDLARLIGVPASALPAVRPADCVAGELTPQGARQLGCRSGTPVLTGLVDTSAALLLASTAPGTLLNASGSTDVLAVVTDDPRPDARCLTRHVGVGKRWLHVMTLAAAGSALAWARSVFFADLSEARYFAILQKVASQPCPASGSSVDFRPYLAGSRVDVEQPAGVITGLRLGTTREDILAALIHALAELSANRLDTLREVSGLRLSRDVLRTGNAGKVLSRVLYARWPRRYRLRDVEEATVRGLGSLAQGLPV